ncbi:RHS repeat-associated core domain-containing protein [Flavobacterium psychrophilum]|nr:RHS repeat-associated core domain-containing protein [Flavobacterium psychrophilum]
MSTLNGQISQHVEYIAFGEVLFEEHSSSFKSPYLFNGKELDRETNLTNFGARYLDMKTSLWLNVDPLAEMYPSVGGYVYCINNPIIHTDPTGRSVDGEFEKDKNGKWQKTSTVGDDIGVDFYHTDGKDKDGNATQNTYVTDRKGNWNSIKNGREALSGEKRGNDVNWENIYDEWSGGYGPERSVFEGDHPANKAIKGNYLFAHAYTDFKDSGLTKSGGAVDFGLLDVMMTDNNMQVQMMGSYNASFYKLGDTTLSLIQDSKSRSSFYLHLPLENYPRGQMEYNFHTKGFVPNDKETNTFQTYLFLAKYPKK